MVTIPRKTKTKRKSYTWIIIALAVVLILYLVLYLVEMKGLQAEQQKTQQQTLQPSEPEATAMKNQQQTPLITEIFIIDHKNKEKFSLEKTEDGLWYLIVDKNTFLAEQQTVAQLLSDIRGFKIGNPTYSGVNYFEAYELEQEQALQATAKAGDEVVFDVLIGKTEKQGEASVTYARWNGEEDIYVTTSFPRAIFLTNPNEYRNKRLCNISRLKMSSVEYSYPADSSFALTKTASGAWLVDGKPGANEDIESFLGTLGFVMSGMYVDMSRGALPKSPKYKVKITGENGEIFDIYAYQTNGKWYLTSSYDENSVWDASNLELLNRIFPSKRSFE